MNETPATARPIPPWEERAKLKHAARLLSVFGHRTSTRALGKWWPAAKRQARGACSGN